MKRASGLVFALTLISQMSEAAEVWRMSVDQPATNFISGVAKDFAKQVRRSTGGALTIEIHANSMLLSREEVKGAVKTGEVELGDVLLSVLSADDPLFEIDSLPFLATDYQQARRLWDASRPLLEEHLQKQGIRLLYSVPWPPQSLFTRREINSLDDFRGMKLRVYNDTTEKMALLLGAVPTSMPTAEVPGAFARGAVEGMLTSSATGVDIRAWSFVDHYYDLRAFIPKNIVIVNEAAFQRLDQATREALLAAAATAQTRGWELSWALAGYQVRMLKRQGVRVVETLPQRLQQDLRQVGERMAQDWLGKAGSDGERVLEHYRGQ